MHPDSLGDGKPMLHKEKRVRMTLKNRQISDYKIGCQRIFYKFQNENGQQLRMTNFSHVSLGFVD